MKDKANSIQDAIERQKAEDLLKKAKVTKLLNTDIEIVKVMHELDVYKVELDMQNDELLLAKKKAELESQKYTELYDFAPTSYFSLTKEGEILELNFRGANLLGKDRSSLIKSNFSFFVSKETRSIFNEYLEQIFNRNPGAKSNCEVVISANSNTPTYVYVNGILNYEGTICNLSILDITDKKTAELQLLHNDLILKSTIECQNDTTIFSIDTNYNYLTYNKAHAQVMKLAHNIDIAIGMNILECMSSDKDKKNSKKNYDRALKGESHSNIKMFGAIDKAYFESFFNPIIDANNKIIGATGLARNITQRIQNEEALKKSEEFLKETQIIANIGSYSLDLTTKKWTSTPILDKIFGIDADFERTIDGWVSIIHPESRAFISDYLDKEVIGNKTQFNKEYKIIKIDSKEELWVQGNGVITFDKKGQPLQIIGSILDINERKQNSIELNKINRVYALISQINNLILRTSNQEELYLGICNIAVQYGKYRMSWIGLVNDDNKIIAAAIAGDERGYLSKAKIIGTVDNPEVRGPARTSIQDGRTVICNDIANDPMMKNWRKLALERGYSSIIAIPIVVSNKIIGSFNLYSNEINSFTSAEEIELLEKITQNIAFTLEKILFEEERMITQEKIRKLSLAVEQSPVTIIITNTKGEIEYANPKFVETTGYSFEEVLNQNPRVLKSGFTSAKEYKNLWLTLLAGNNWRGELHNKRKDGSLYWESASISPIVNSEGNTTHYIAIKEDITHRKNLEKILVKSKERAEESDRLKLAFLANMSHEIRTPMNGILGFTELLKEPKLTGEVQQEFINIIEKSGKRMLNIINDIISISKVESGQVDVSLSETDVNKQIEYIHTFFKPELKQKGIQINISKQLSPKDNLIKTDREKLYAILTNLVKNALKFTNEGSIELGCVKKEGNLEFFVKDTGLGIAKSQKKIIFERFRQADETISRTHEGSGLGLSISKAYVELLGGKIWVESKIGEGSSFYFTIPFQAEEKHEEKVVVKNKDGETKKEIKNLKVLIVEDDAISKLLITIALKPYTKEIIKVSNGIEAIEACRNNPDIDLVMMDINMPIMGGYEATKHIREFNKDLVIIAQTAKGMESDREDAIAAGCTDYLSKPINIKTLSELMHEYF